MVETCHEAGGFQCPCAGWQWADQVQLGWVSTLPGSILAIASNQWQKGAMAEAAHKIAVWAVWATNVLKWFNGLTNGQWCFRFAG